MRVGLWGMVCGLLLLAGCQSQMRVLEAGGNIRVERSTVAGSDYAVHIKNALDFGFNPDDRANRHKWALDYLKTQCPGGRVVSEDEIVTGQYLTGRPSKTYAVYVKCG